MSQSSSFEFSPNYFFSPGETLAEVIQELGMSQADLARRSGLSVKHINQIAQGVATISAETALRLERVTARPARFWTTLDAAYQVGRVEAQESGDDREATDWLKALPVRELQKRGWLSETNDQLLLLRDALGFFRVATPSAWSNVWAVETSYRKSQAFEPDYGALASWIRIGELRSNAQELPAYDRSAFRGIVSQLRSLTKLREPNDMLKQLIELCRVCGVAVVVEPEIKGSRINGVVRWLPTGNPLIMLSLRHSWADIFWFTFFHEVGHLLVHDRKKATFVDVPPGKSKDAPFMSGSENRLLEAEADDFAGRTLIPRSFEAQLRSIDSTQDAISVAAEIDVHPGIVVGRLQHEGIVPHNQMNELRDRFKFVR